MNIEPREGNIKTVQYSILYGKDKEGIPSNFLRSSHVLFSLFNCYVFLLLDKAKSFLSILSFIFFLFVIIFNKDLWFCRNIEYWCYFTSYWEMEIHKTLDLDTRPVMQLYQYHSPHLPGSRQSTPTQERGFRDI